jgi:tetratricopeptide (TPR) repeat protein
MTTQLDLFISSKMLELKPERDALYDLLPTLSTGSVSLRAWVFEAGDGAPASNKTIRDVYLKALENSALYIGLFWNLYGEWTIDEFERATEWGIDRHIYVKDVDAGQRDSKLTDFLNKQGAVTAGVTAKWFKTTDELREAVRHSLAVWLEERMVRRPGSTSATFAKDADDLLERPLKLIGRDDLLAQTNTLLDSGEPVLLQGFGGMGKTALAAEVAAHRIAAGKGPALWLRAGDETHEALFEAMARPFNMQQEIAKETGDAQLQAVRQLLKSRGVKLLVLDDVWNARALAQVMKAVPRDLSLLVTARQRYPALRLIDVGKLARPASLELLSYHAGTDYAADTSAESLCARLGDSAYALRVAGMTMAVDRLTPAAMLQRIENAPHKLKMPPGFADEGQESVAALLEASLNAMYLAGTEGKQAHAVFLAFGALFAPSATPELLTLYMGHSVGAHGGAPSDNGVEPALTELQRRGLADRIEQTQESVAHYRVHDLAYSYTRAQIIDDQRHKALDACLAYTERYNEPKVENFAALRPELDNFIGAVEWGLNVKRYDGIQLVTRLGIDGSDVLEYQGLYTQALVLLNRALDGAKQLNDYDNISAFLGNLGVVYSNLGRFEQAKDYHEQALAIAYRIGNRMRAGIHLGNLGLVDKLLGKYERAADNLHHAIVIAHDINNREAEAAHLSSLGGLYYGMGNYGQAIEQLQQALAISRETNNPLQKGYCLGDLGVIYQELGEHRRAIDYCQQALTISRDIGHRDLECTVLGNLSVSYTQLGQLDAALEYGQRALALAHDMGDRNSESINLSNLGNIYGDLGQREKGIQYHQQALAIAREIGNRANEGRSLGDLATSYVYLDYSHYSQAIEYYLPALAIAREIGDRAAEGNHLIGLGEAHFYLCRLEQAVAYYQQSRFIFDALGAQHLVQKLDQRIALASNPLIRMVAFIFGPSMRRYERHSTKIRAEQSQVEEPGQARNSPVASLATQAARREIGEANRQKVNK